MEKTFRHQTDLAQMRDDIIKAAELAEVPYDRDVIRRVLQAYGDFFGGSAVTFVTSTRPEGKRGLSVRYVELQVPHDPYAIALAEGFITPKGEPIDALLPEIRSRYDILGYGVDMEVGYGLAKIWVFIRPPQPIERAYGLSSLPQSVRSHADYFSRHGLDIMSLFALDYRHRSTNIYFMVKEPGQFTPDMIGKMIGDLDLEVPSREILEYCTNTITIYPTFNWESTAAERLCLGMAAPTPEMVPTQLHPLIERYTRQVPILSQRRIFIFSVTPARDETYIKIESDYTGSMVELMQQGARAVP
jgi:hypothetical protein